MRVGDGARCTGGCFGGDGGITNGFEFFHLNITNSFGLNLISSSFVFDSMPLRSIKIERMMFCNSKNIPTFGLGKSSIAFIFPFLPFFFFLPLSLLPESLPLSLPDFDPESLPEPDPEPLPESEPEPDPLPESLLSETESLSDPEPEPDPDSLSLSLSTHHKQRFRLSKHP